MAIHIFVAVVVVAVSDHVEAVIVVVVVFCGRHLLWPSLSWFVAITFVAVTVEP